MATERSARTPPLRNRSPKSSFHRRSPAATQPDGVSSSARIARQAARPWWRRGGAFGSRKLGWNLACLFQRRPPTCQRVEGAPVWRDERTNLRRRVARLRCSIGRS